MNGRFSIIGGMWLPPEKVYAYAPMIKLK